jgi:hypothetical protein
VLKALAKSSLKTTLLAVLALRATHWLTTYVDGALRALQAGHAHLVGPKVLTGRILDRFTKHLAHQAAQDFANGDWSDPTVLFPERQPGMGPILVGPRLAPACWQQQPAVPKLLATAASCSTHSLKLGS